MIGVDDIGCHPTRVQQQRRMLKYNLKIHRDQYKSALHSLNHRCESICNAQERLTIIELYMRQEGITPIDEGSIQEE